MLSYLSILADGQNILLASIIKIFFDSNQRFMVHILKYSYKINKFLSKYIFRP